MASRDDARLGEREPAHVCHWRLALQRRFVQIRRLDRKRHHSFTACMIEELRQQLDSPW
jgi:hypothetical protein